MKRNKYGRIFSVNIFYLKKRVIEISQTGKKIFKFYLKNII